MSKITSRICPKHGETDFYIFERKHKKSVNYKCKKCNVEAVDKKRKRLKLQAIEYKGGKCEICSYSKSIWALEFHHINPNEKDFAVGSSNTRSWIRIKNELDKCILVCSNCHREIHENY